MYGVAIPTVNGVRNVLNTVGAAAGARKVLWHNMREEPVIYINGRPYVVREADQPFCNLEYTGIDRCGAATGRVGPLCYSAVHDLSG